jgi:hypothetical protein
MYCRSRPQYRSDLGWILGVAFLGTLTRLGPACTGLHLRSVLQRASGFFPTRPHGARPDCLATPPPACSCLRLAVASNLLRRGLAPPIQGPCLAHQEFDGKERLKCTQVPMLRRPTLDRPLCSDSSARTWSQPSALKHATAEAPLRSS